MGLKLHSRNEASFRTAVQVKPDNAAYQHSLGLSLVFQVNFFPSGLCNSLPLKDACVMSRRLKCHVAPGTPLSGSMNAAASPVICPELA